MSDLGSQVLERVQASGLSDQDQRSALGIARTWVEKQKPVPRSVIPGYEKRDDLATELVAILEGSAAEPKQCIKALGEARKVINRPYQDPTMQGHKTKLELLKPKDR